MQIIDRLSKLSQLPTEDTEYVFIENQPNERLVNALLQQPGEHQVWIPEYKLSKDHSYSGFNGPKSLELFKLQLQKSIAAELAHRDLEVGWGCQLIPLILIVSMFRPDYESQMDKSRYISTSDYFENYMNEALLILNQTFQFTVTEEERYSKNRDKFYKLNVNVHTSLKDFHDKPINQRDLFKHGQWLNQIVVKE